MNSSTGAFQTGSNQNDAPILLRRIDVGGYHAGTVKPKTVDTNTDKTHFLIGLYRWFQVPRVHHYPLSTSQLSCDPGWPG